MHLSISMVAIVSRQNSSYSGINIGWPPSLLDGILTAVYLCDMSVGSAQTLPYRRLFQLLSLLTQLMPDQLVQVSSILLKNWTSLAEALVMTKSITNCCEQLKSELDVKQNHLRGRWPDFNFRLNQDNKVLPN